MTGSSQTPCLVWFRQDLRLSDNPALAAAVERRAPIIPVYIWAPEEEGAWPPGGASKWWLAQSLASLNSELERRNLRLILRCGPTAKALMQLVAETGATAVYWNRRYEPAVAARDHDVKRRLSENGLVAESFNSSLLFEPWTIQNQSGQPFRVFSAFWRACMANSIDPPRTDVPARMISPRHWPHSLEISNLELEPKVDWAAGFREVWQPGEMGARRALKRFLKNGLDRYPHDRNRPDLTGTSRLSPHLHFGEIGPGEVWRALTKRETGSAEAREAYLREIGWREFAYHLLYHHPESPHKPIRPEFANFVWHEDPSLFKVWKRGMTGYPLVDAGMRELWHTGWMHNRVRMVVASFLVKHLLIPWQQGAAWFWDTLVDADLANNTLGWQWTAGCGADAAPYFRIFSPSLQVAKFDPHRAYVSRWVPEFNQRNGGSKGSSRYPNPIVNHDKARGRALAAFARIKAGGGKGSNSVPGPLQRWA